MRYICHPELRRRVVSVWDFKGEESNSQEDESRCLVNKCLLGNGKQCDMERNFNRQILLNSSLSTRPIVM